ncbi:hypothetical protein [Leptolinea tardivitalis]|uniref:Uncharacterized protein n=1 Tax=Leptolinea tardivitalis TaxID=229920 RepID=A0A0P6XF14_9CHLR|nr:hypothetical protein [Leptolinea tardivitalis]KPL73399.1 hypothetical protein ADM99_04140 [Leptolinea tardivitalis]GAP21552.1 hypothetical protein LTAR_01763 [Leptolinea tardivitalis]
MKLKRIVMIVLSAGWLLPVNLGISSFFSWAQYELEPRLNGVFPGNSFPFLGFAGQMIAVGSIWLAVAITVWVIKVFNYINMGR